MMEWVINCEMQPLAISEILQEIKLEGRARSVPIIKNGKLIIACENDNVNIFAVSE